MGYLVFKLHNIAITSYMLLLSIRMFTTTYLLNYMHCSYSRNTIKHPNKAVNSDPSSNVLGINSYNNS